MKKKISKREINSLKKIEDKALSVIDDFRNREITVKCTVSFTIENYDAPIEDKDIEKINFWASPDFEFKHHNIVFHRNKEPKVLSIRDISKLNAKFANDLIRANKYWRKYQHTLRHLAKKYDLSIKEVVDQSK